MLAVQRRAFTRVAGRLGIDTAVMPPLCETADELAASMASGTVFLVAVDAAGAILGTVRTTADDGGVVEVGRLAVEDGHERRGIATALLAAVETLHPDASRFELFTGADAADALALYERAGYACSRSETDPGGIPLVWMAKEPR